MGVRVHKAIGYGTAEFEPPAGFKEAEERLTDMTSRDFAAWCAERRADVEALSDPAYKSAVPLFGWDLRTMADELAGESLWKSIAWGNPMYNDAKKQRRLLLTPPTAHDWRRLDDAIDYVEECERAGKRGPRDRLVPVSCGLYPYDLGRPPLTIAAMCLFLGIPDWLPRLRESVYVWWC
jgi:hypothetical protein